MKVLGLDPGSRITGYAVVSDGVIVDAGVFRLKQKELGHRLSELLCDIVALLSKHPDLDAVGVESPFINPKFRNAIIPLAQARGVLLAAVAGAGHSHLDISPSSVKQAVGVGGNASKAQVASAMKLAFRQPQGLNKIAQDVYDALAVAEATRGALLPGSSASRKPKRPRTLAGGRKRKGRPSP